MNGAASKKIATILAFVMMVNIFGSTVGVRTAYAAPDSFQVENNNNKSIRGSDTFVYGQINDSPVLSGRSTPTEEKAMLSWDFSAPFGDYVLTYPIAKDTKAELTVIKDSMTAAKVSFRLLDSAGVEKKPSRDKDFFSVYSYLASKSSTEGDSVFVLASEYMAKHNLSDGFRVTSSSAAIFDIGKGNGFSFNFTIGQTYTMSFLWDNSDNRFYFETDNVKLGNLYDFELEKDKTAVQKVSYFPGIDVNKMEAVPTANDGLMANNVIDMSLNMTSPPGSEIAGIKFGIPRPKQWSGSDFTSPVSTSMEVRFTLGSSNDTGNFIPLIIGNINAASPSATSPRGEFEIKNGVSDGDMFRFEVNGLEPITIFDESTIMVIPNSSSGILTGREIDIQDEKIFTFVQYTVEYVAGKYHIYLYPYKDSTGRNRAGHYMLRVGHDANPNTHSMRAVQHTKDSDEVLDFELSLNEINLDKQFFQIFFKPGDSDFIGGSVDGAIYSQISTYQAMPGDLSLSAPFFFDVTSYNLEAKSGTIDGSKGNLNMSISFDVGAVSIIDKILAANNGSYDIKYSMEKRLTTIDGSKFNDPVVFSEFNLNLTKSSSGVLSGSLTDSGGNVIINSLKLTTKTVAGNDHYQADLSLTLDAELGGLDADPMNDRTFYYPNIYFINIGPTMGGQEVLSPKRSPDKTITLNEFTKTLAPPQDIKADTPKTTSVELGDAKDETSFKVSWEMPSNNISAYLDSFPFPATSATAVANLYISQSESKMKALDRSKTLETALYDPASALVMYFSDINNASAMAIGNSGKGYNNGRDALRNGEVIVVQDIPLDLDEMLNKLANGEGMVVEYTLDGLDKNQKYYVYVDIELTLRYIDNNGDVQSRPSLSSLSGMAGITTLGDKIVPNPDEKTPLTPNLRKEEVTIDSATMSWKDVAGGSELIEYEFIRIQGEEMPSEHLDKRENFSVFWNTYLGEIGAKAGYDTAGSAMRAYDGSGFVEDGNNYIYTAEDTAEGRLLYFTDQGLVPNQHYYYYIRAVKKLDGKIVAYSVWSMLYMKTELGGKPENLKVEQARTDYNSETEAVISFDVPLSSSSQIGTDYILQYQLKEGGEDWQDPKDMDPNALKSSATMVGVGKCHLTYKITGLEPGKTYTVRVRMLYIDKKTQERYALLYSDAKNIRTELNQDDYDDKVALETWSGHLRDRLQKLLTDPYWLTENSSSKLEVVYRPTMFGNLITETTDGTVTLYGTEAVNAVYYLPASALVSVNGSTKALRLVFGNLELIIPPSAIDTNLNSSIITANQAVKEGSISDYYVRLTVGLRAVSGTIDGNKALTNQITTSFDLVGTNQTTEAFDKAIINRLTRLVSDAAANSSVLDSIKDKITDSETDEEMVKEINRLVALVRNDLIEEVRDSLADIKKTTDSVSGLNKSMIIVAKAADASISMNGYQNSAGLWIAKETVNYSGGRAIYVQPGSYAFAGRSVTIFLPEGLKDSAAISAIIAQYGLEDYLGNLGVMSDVSVENNATRDMLIGIVARIAGAPKTATPTDWLSQNKKLVVSSRNGQGQLQTQEGLYLMMSLYEFKTGTKVSQMTVRNYGITANVPNLEDKYKAHIRAAYEIGLYTEGKLQPTAVMKIKDILNMLGTLGKKVKL